MRGLFFTLKNPTLSVNLAKGLLSVIFLVLGSLVQTGEVDLHKLRLSLL